MTKKPIKKYAIETKHVAGIAQYPYADGKGRPRVVVLHDTGNDSSTISGEIAYMSRNWSSAFVHAWADADHIIETADTDFLCWGAGPNINTTALQIELVHEHNKSRFLESLDRWIFWAAFQCYWYNIKPTDATDDGSGTIWTHAAVSKFKGGTDHVDPMPYVTKRSAELTGKGLGWKQVFNKLVEYYNVLEKSGDTRKVKMLGQSAPKPAAPKKAPVKKAPQKVSVRRPAASAALKTYVVKKGDTLWKIAQDNKLTVESLKKLNGLKDNSLEIGQKLKLKAATTAKAKSPAATKVKARLTNIEAVAFLKSAVGQYFDYDGAFKYQCYDFANAYWHALYKHGFSGLKAAEIHADNAKVLAKEATVFKKTATNRPKAGDVVLFDWTPWEREDFGHVAVVLSAGDNGMTVVEQNADGKADKPANRRSCSYNGVTYFIRPTFK